MKNTRKLIELAIIAIIAIATIGIVACNNGDNDNNKPETFTLSFNANGGTPQPQPQTIAKGGKASEPTAPTKTNYSLVGWYKETALTTEWDFDADTVTAEITLHAKWWEIQYITDTTYTNLKVPIYQTAGVADQDAITIATAIKAGYAGLSNKNRGTLATANNFKKIEIVPGVEASFDAETGSVTIGTEYPYTAGYVLEYIVIPKLTKDE
jgi:uncharacterized repeat protein (TIGR02543 family)